MDSPIADSAVNVDSLIIGAGQAGLAMSACLRMRGIDHVVLERGRIGERWRSERWDSFTLLSPNWQTRLPGHHYRGGDPDGFMTGREVVDLLERYAASAPVRTGVTVHDARPDGDRWRVSTSAGEWECRNVVVATGDLDQPRIPPVAADLPPDLLQLHTSQYRNPAQLPDGGVLVVGAGPSGQQIADELARPAGGCTWRSAGTRCCPGGTAARIAYWWMDRLGMLSRTVDTLSHPDEKHAPNAVLTGGMHDLDLHRLVRSGVRPHGRLTGVDGTIGHLRGQPGANRRRRRRSPPFGSARRSTSTSAAPGWTRPRTGRPSISRPAAPGSAPRPSPLELRAQRICGRRVGDRIHRRPELAAGGAPEHRVRRTPAGQGRRPMSGLYFLGLKWQHRRSSHTIDGVGRDAEYLADHISATGSRELQREDGGMSDWTWSVPHGRATGGPVPAGQRARHRTVHRALRGPQPDPLRRRGGRGDRARRHRRPGRRRHRDPERRGRRGPARAGIGFPATESAIRRAGPAR